jgi:hypothetical protein
VKAIPQGTKKERLNNPFARLSVRFQEPVKFIIYGKLREYRKKYGYLREFSASQKAEKKPVIRMGHRKKTHS